jgi:hypothetical protein
MEIPQRMEEKQQEKHRKVIKKAWLLKVQSKPL